MHIIKSLRLIPPSLQETIIWQLVIRISNDLLFLYQVHENLLTGSKRTNSFKNEQTVLSLWLGSNTIPSVAALSGMSNFLTSWHDVVIFIVHVWKLPYQLKNHKKFHNVFSNVMILCWALFIANLGGMCCVSYGTHWACLLDCSLCSLCVDFWVERPCLSARFLFFVLSWQFFIIHSLITG